jgi:ABC-type multidrug transport system ATPase subunit
MKIILNNVGKRYNSEWIFRGLSSTIDSTDKYVILGSNGSGKSTLLKVIASSVYTSEGNINYRQEGNEIQAESIFRHISIAAPYLELIEEFTLREIINFQQNLKPMVLEANQIIELLKLEKSANKALRYYSSGMKQRVKLGLAILAETPILLLDEPTSNLDHKGIDWYQEMITNYAKDKLLIVCSNNQKEEFFICNQEIRIEDYKSLLQKEKS